VKAAGFAGVLAVLAWASWSALDSSSSGRPETVTLATVRPAAMPSAPAPSLALAAPVALTPPVVKESPAGIVHETSVRQPGQMPLVQSSPLIATQPAIRPAVALPPGARAEDVEVSPSGMVTVLRSPVGTATPSNANGPSYGAAATPDRPVTLLRSP
jgi:hypothetical protein